MATTAFNPQPILEVNDLLVQREGRNVLEVEHLAVDQGEVLAVIGPNGAGKSTLMLTLSRLLQPSRGQILFRGQSLSTLSELEYRRRIGLVLQEPLLVDAPVFDNVAMGLRFRGLPKAEVKARAEEWLQRMGVSHLRDRRARKLSGGEAQRVSLARAFALQPEVLLLDEPFSSLDAPTRARLLDDFQVVLAATKITTILITHDLDEALYLGGRVAVLLAGRLRQSGPPQAVFSAPADPEVAAFVGIETVIAGEVVSSSDGHVSVKANGFNLQAVAEVAVGRSVLFCVRPEDITLWPGELDGGEPGGKHSSARNRLSGRVQRLIPQGPLARVVVDCGFPLVALITRASAQEMDLSEGAPVTATFKASVVHLIPR